LFGLAVFETLRVRRGIVVCIDAHLERLRASASVVGASVPADVADQLRARAVGDCVLRVTLTAGGRSILMRGPWDPDYAGRPVSLATLVDPPAPGLPGSVKHTNRARWTLAARALGANEVLLVDAERRVLETSNSNIWALIDGTLHTPPADGRILAGITRMQLLAAARRAGMDAREQTWRVDAPVQGLWVSSTLKELAPVRQLDGHPVAAHPVGEVLRQAFRAGLP
jgi:branched-subunit amino acid aminotransferase/4-amino-4-deoxychorismate lyase